MPEEKRHVRRTKGCITCRGRGGRETEVERIGRSDSRARGWCRPRGARKSSGKAAEKETAADRFVKPPRRKKTRPDTPSSRLPQAPSIRRREIERKEKEKRHTGEEKEAR